jgi:two-component system, NarL family, sensor histidine kinase DevS
VSPKEQGRVQLKNPTSNSPSEESRMRALHRATLTLFSDLSLDGVLRRIIHAARELVNARYAALGIPDGKGGLETFITLGLSEGQIKAISHEPEGKGLLGEMLRLGHSIRIPDIEEHPKSAGFPEGHPPMTSFLGVPISAYGRPIGQIYLTDKRDADGFSAEDQRLIEMLASHAAAAIENARLYRQILDNEAELTQRNMELELINTLTTSVSSAMELDRMLEVMLARVIQLIGAKAGEVFLLEEAQGIYRKSIHSGPSLDALWDQEQFREGEGFIGRVVRLGKPAWTTKLEEEPHLHEAAVKTAGIGTIVGVPLTAPSKIVGIFTLAFEGERVIEEREIGLLEAVGAGAGIAVENARLYRQARRLAVLEERERIAMDLHDGIIQSVYAVGLILEYIRLQIHENPDQAVERLEQAITGLNEVIGDLRSYILDLQPSRMSVDNLGAALEQLRREFRANTLVDVDLKTEAKVLESLPNPKARELFHIAQEALANVAKHARATQVMMSVRSLGDDVTLQVIDNGVGFEVGKEQNVLGHGLSNMVERARNIGAKFEVASHPGEGTTITVRLPKTDGR